jgi:hypothetical protein
LEEGLRRNFFNTNVASSPPPPPPPPSVVVVAAGVVVADDDLRGFVVTFWTGKVDLVKS